MLFFCEGDRLAHEALPETERAEREREADRRADHMDEMARLDHNCNESAWWKEPETEDA